MGVRVREEDEEEGGKGEKHVFFQLLESILWD